MDTVLYSVICSNIALLTCQNKVEKMSFVRKLQQFVPIEREWQILDICFVKDYRTCENEAK